LRLALLGAIFCGDFVSREVEAPFARAAPALKTLPTGPVVFVADALAGGGHASSYTAESIIV
jgi:hypothetical protein